MSEIVRPVAVKKAEIPGKEQIPGPVQGDLKPARPRRQLEEVHASPQKPGQNAEIHACKHFRHGLIAPIEQSSPRALKLNGRVADLSELVPDSERLPA